MITGHRVESLANESGADVPSAQLNNSIKDLALIGAQAHIELFYDGRELLVGLYDRDGVEELIEAFGQLGFRVVSKESDVRFTINKVEDELPPGPSHFPGFMGLAGPFPGP